MGIALNRVVVGVCIWKYCVIIAAEAEFVNGIGPAKDWGKAASFHKANAMGELRLGR